MKNISLFSFVILAMALSSCTAAQTVATQTAEFVEGNGHKQYPWGKLVCHEGPVCAKLELVRVQNDDDKKITVRLRNRTHHALTVQVGFEWLDDSGLSNDRSRFHDVPMAPHQEGELSLHGPRKASTTFNVIVRDRRAL